MGLGLRQIRGGPEKEEDAGRQGIYKAKGAGRQGLYEAKGAGPQGIEAEGHPQHKAKTKGKEEATKNVNRYK